MPSKCKHRHKNNYKSTEVKKKHHAPIYISTRFLRQIHLFPLIKSVQYPRSPITLHKAPKKGASLIESFARAQARVERDRERERAKKHLLRRVRVSPATAPRKSSYYAGRHTKTSIHTQAAERATRKTTTLRTLFVIFLVNSGEARPGGRRLSIYRTQGAGEGAAKT